MRIEKERNLFKFYLDGKTKPYVLDVNSGVVLGLRGNPIETVPSAVRNWGEYHKEHYPLYIWWWTKEYSRSSVTTRKMLLMADRLQNALPNISGNELCDIVSARTIDNNYDTIEREFASLVRFIQDGGRDFSEWQRDILRNHIMRRCNLPSDVDPRILDFFVNRPEFIDKPYTAYYIAHGLGEWFEWNEYNITTRLRAFYQYCGELHIQPQKSDFFKQYIAVRKNWLMNKAKIENEKLAKNQLAHKTALEFETDELVVIIPTTRDEFKFEGDSQHNCVYTNYLSACVDGRTNVVFIRKKANPSQSYITCEVRKGYINQYLGRHNGWVNDEVAIAFKDLYAEHIRKNWGE